MYVQNSLIQTGCLTSSSRGDPRCAILLSTKEAEIQRDSENVPLGYNKFFMPCTLLCIELRLLFQLYNNGYRLREDQVDPFISTIPLGHVLQGDLLTT